MKYVFVMTVLMFAGSANAQIEKGSIFAKGGASLIKDPQFLNANISTDIHYAFSTHWSIGLGVQHRFSEQKGIYPDAFKYSLAIAPTITYFKPLGERFLFSAFAYNPISITKELRTPPNYINVNAGVSLDYFISKRFALGISSNLFNVRLEETNLGNGSKNKLHPSVFLTDDLFNSTRIKVTYVLGGSKKEEKK